MPQLFQVLKCYKCLVFQVHQTKKSNKWECKLCGEKQSIKRHYGLGTGKECRLHVQKLNGIRGEVDELNESIALNNSSEDLENSPPRIVSSHIKQPKNKSKWSNYIDKTESVEETNGGECMFLGNTEVVLEVPAKKKRRFKTPKATHKSTTNCHKNVINDHDLTDVNENKSIIFCISDLAVQNTIPKSNGSKIDTFLKVSVSEKENFNTPQEEIFKFNDNSEASKIKIQDNNPIKTYVPPKLNMNSKWAQYADTYEQGEEHEADQTHSSISIITGASSFENISISRKNSSENVPKNLFTLCDESELDDVLDF